MSNKDNQKCHICDGITDWECQTCELPVCEDCTVAHTVLNNVTETLCQHCEDQNNYSREVDMEADHQWHVARNAKKAKAKIAARATRLKTKLAKQKRQTEIYQMPFAEAFTGLSKITPQQVQDFVDYFEMKRLMSVEKFEKIESVMWAGQFMGLDKYNIQSTPKGIAYDVTDAGITLFRAGKGGGYAKAVRIAMHSDWREFNMVHSVFLAKNGFYILKTKMAFSMRLDVSSVTSYISLTKSGPIILSESEVNSNT